ncbi:YIP1 family protein [Chitinimonas arctica]|nr:YIP1 family protein [Chitinimonas arctica]
MQLLTALTEPSKLYTELKQRPSFILPMLLMLVGTVAVWLLYFQRVDSGWLVETMVTAGGGTPAEQEMMRKSMNPDMLMWWSVIAAPVFIVIFQLMLALYYKLAGKVAGAEYGFRAWFGFVNWSGVPLLLSTVASLISVLTMSPQTSPQGVAPTHLDPLLVELAMDHPWQSWATSLDLLNLWCIALAAIGWRVWTGTGWGKAVGVALLPHLVIYGIWAAVILARS